MKSFFSRISQYLPRRNDSRRGQSYLELALVLPILLIMLLGLVEVTFFISRYLDLIDLTREAARFASVRDPFTQADLSTVDCSHPDPFNFYYHTACIFSPPADSTTPCADPKFCNGLNPFVVLNEATDDVVVSVYTVSDHAVTDQWPTPDGYWALSDHDADTAHNSNWQTDCQGNVIHSEPHFTQGTVDAALDSLAPKSKGLVAVEFYYCYDQVLSIPILTNFIPNPLRIHVYTTMPLPAAQPTATPNSAAAP
ncbi:MAG: pilus assembly protein [Chloroflexi bacterium]|jgi:hypothetical protein|nr:TadE/TadG family type IV pilus assembly protein [Anaerolineaceae bacterium]NMB89417.1 pilus assembly protein [Chloroflexota bacterium]